MNKEREAQEKALQYNPPLPNNRRLCDRGRIDIALLADVVTIMLDSDHYLEFPCARPIIRSASALALPLRVIVKGTRERDNTERFAVRPPLQEFTDQAPHHQSRSCKVHQS